MEVSTKHMLKISTTLKRMVSGRPIRPFYRPASQDAGFVLLLIPKGVLFHNKLIKYYVMLLLLLDILLYGRFIKTYCTHIISNRPNAAVSKLIFEICMLIENHECTLSLKISHKTRYSYLRRNALQHMNMVAHHMVFD